jgi:hypothetical protein
MSAYPEAQYVIDELSEKLNGIGMKLAAPTNVTLTNFDEAVKISWTDPDDVTVTGGGVWASWKGTLVVRKEGSAPTSASDGVTVVNSTVRNQYSSTPYVDSGLTNGVTYYYGIFPYTEAIIYNFSTTASITPSAIVPDAPTITSIQGGDAQAVISFTSTTAEASVKFVFKEGSAPASDTDGTVYSPYTTSPATVTGLTNGTTYYVAAYAYTAKRISLASPVVTVKPLAIVQLAFHYSENDSSPDSVTYPAGYYNSDFTDPFYVDLSTGTPHYGDWDFTDSALSWLLPKSCMLKYDGTVDYYLDESDETKKEDGVTSSDVANSSYGGNAMMEWGQNGKKIYWKIVPDSDGKGFTFVVADSQVDNDMKPWNHYNCDGQIAEHFYTPKYFGSSDGTRLRSISGGTNYVSHTRNDEITQAKANNTTSKVIWNTEVYCDWFFLSMLCTLISKSTNSQAKFGYGYANNNSGAINQGTMNGRGMFYGENTGKYGVKVFGMENPWGNLNRAIAGLINDNGSIKLKLTYGTQDGSTTTGYNTTGSGYISHGSAPSASGYISGMNITVSGLTPKITSGSDSTYYTDNCYVNNSQVNYALVGGPWDSGLFAGAFYCYLYNTASSAYTSRGAALSCKPLA